MKRELYDDIKTVLIFGSGPITIGQACEFDYSGTQACKALREEGKRVVLLNSNPATIMTDPEIADKTYVEPLDPTIALSVIRKEGVDAILPTMGGQTALNLVTALSKIPQALDGIKIIGANLKSIYLAEDRRAFRELLASLKMDTPRSQVIRSLKECRNFAESNGYPFILRPSYTLGGSGQSFVFAENELKEKCLAAIEASPIGEVLVEESALGWKEYELEVMRDFQDNAIVVCSIENLDAMGVHTGDSITVAPAQTLTDREYQSMRSEALRLVRKVGVETGGCNVQFAVHPETGRRIVIEMNPRVSRSSALASKATGFPIAYVAAKLALGYTLPEIDNVITQSSKACFEPPIDYVALKIPRWHFEKFPGSVDSLKPQMQSVGEVLAIAASFGEAFHKALNSLEKDWPNFQNSGECEGAKFWESSFKELLVKPHSKRGFAIWDALASGVDPDQLAEWVCWDPWFVHQIKSFIESKSFSTQANRFNDGDCRFEMIDTCSAENRAETPFFYSTRETLAGDPELRKKYGSPHAPLLPNGKRGRVVILGSGPNRIGQGVEFDYCCVHASKALQKLGYETIMINCNPETVSTDPTSSDRLYLEPLHEKTVLDILQFELDPVIANGKEAAVVLQTGGQTPLKLAAVIEKRGYKILGTNKKAIDTCEDRVLFSQVLDSLGVHYPKYGMAHDLNEARKVASALEFPVLVRPSFVLGGRGMVVCSHDEDLVKAFKEAKQVNKEYPLYMDRFLVGAVEFDVDGICDGKEAWVAGVMEHVEEAGVHSGDSACVIPPLRLPPTKLKEMIQLAKKIAVATTARGLFNIQMALHDDQIFVIEANPRASRTVPYLAKATGFPLIEWGMRASTGESVSAIVPDRDFEALLALPGEQFAVKLPVFPFEKFENVDPILGPEMRSTGEVMGMDRHAGAAFAKAFLAAGMRIPASGTVLFSVRDADKAKAMNIARVFNLLGFDLMGTPGTARYLESAGINCTPVAKIGKSTNEQGLLEVLNSKKVGLVVNTVGNVNSIRDGVTIRKAALQNRIPLLSTIAAAEMASMAIQTLMKLGSLNPEALQDKKRHSISAPE